MSARLRLAWGVASFAWGVLRGALVWLLTRDRRRATNVVTAHMADVICRIVLTDVKLHDVERALAAEPCVIIANHQSILDLQVLAHLHRRLRDPVVMAKLVGKWNLPVLKPLFRATGNIVVDPASPMRSGAALKRARVELRAGRTVMLYPEGTRSPDGGLGPFQRGAFALAIAARVPLVPVVVSHFKPRFDMRAGIVLPQLVNVRVLEPVRTEGLTRAETLRLRDDVRGLMQAALDADDRERGIAAGHAPSLESLLPV